MTIVTEFDLETNTWTHHGDNGARAAWREAVAEIAVKAKDTLPDCAGRVDRAVAIVLNHDVELLEDGTAKVASQSSGKTQYVVCNGGCQCRDYKDGKAPSGWCKHRIAAGLYKRATAHMQRTLAQHTNGTSNGHSAPAPAPAQLPAQEAAPAHAEASLPEAPASVNVHLELHGREVQLTLRDRDEGRLLQRLEAVLARFPVVSLPSSTQGNGAAERWERPGWCAPHSVQMTENHGKDGSTWYSHKLADGTWCKGR